MQISGITEQTIIDVSNILSSNKIILGSVGRIGGCVKGRIFEYVRDSAILFLFINEKGSNKKWKMVIKNLI